MQVCNVMLTFVLFSGLILERARVSEKGLINGGGSGDRPLPVLWMKSQVNGCFTLDCMFLSFSVA